MKALLILPVLALAACGMDPNETIGSGPDMTVEERAEARRLYEADRRDRLEGIVDFAMAQLATWNALGVDPLQYDQYRPLIAAACGTIAGAADLVEADYLNGAEVIQYCRPIVAAVGAAPAS